MAIKTEVGR